MRVTDIRIKNYRAFYGEHHICLDKDGKNLMMYGENGSGKSSLYTGLKDFFLSSVQKLQEVEENIFTPASQKDKAFIKLTIRESETSSKTTDFELNAIQKEIVSADKLLIADANKIKGFFDYRSLLKTHLDFSGEVEVDIFDNLIKYILPHAINRFTNKEIGNEWSQILKEYHYYKVASRVEWLHKNTDSFSKGLKLLLQEIEADTNKFLAYFDKSMSAKIVFDNCYYEETDKEIEGNNAILKITFYKKDVRKHHLFLNEARLTALAICLYLASIKVNPTKGALKILVLDDLLIGLDMSNRLPLLALLKENFIEVNVDQRFQIIMTTYDKIWYELVKNYFGVEKWKFIEVYSKKLQDDDFEIPLIKHDNGYLDKAKKHLEDKDFKASAVYIRTEFERLVKTICDKQRIPVSYRKNQKDVTSEDFWTAIESQTNIDPALVAEITIHKGVVMNPFSHYDLEKPEFEKELSDTIASIKKLSDISGTIKKNQTVDKLKKEIETLTDKLSDKDKTIKELSEAKVAAKPADTTSE